MQRLRALCNQYGIVFIADEIQTGFARTGRMFAMEHYGVEPDLMTLAKSLAGGFPLAAVVGKSSIMDAPTPGGLGGTYAGSPISCAAALAVLEVMREERLPERAQHLGEVVMSRLSALQSSLPCVGEVRGLGAMLAMELVKDRNRHEPDAELAKALVQRAAQNGLILLSCGIYSNVIRILMPLTASDVIVQEGLDILERSLRELLSS